MSCLDSQVISQKIIAFGDTASAVVPCVYYEQGCMTRIVRSAMRQHLADESVAHASLLSAALAAERKERVVLDSRHNAKIDMERKARTELHGKLQSAVEALQSQLDIHAKLLSTLQTDMVSLTKGDEKKRLSKLDFSAAEAAAASVTEFLSQRGVEKDVKHTGQTGSPTQLTTATSPTAAGASAQPLSTQPQLTISTGAVATQTITNTTHSTLELLLQLHATPPDQRKVFLRERLFPLVAAQLPALAGKITGMFLEMDSLDVVRLLESPPHLEAKLNDAIAMLLLAQASTPARLH